jgi:hypothetical protein
VSGQRKEFIVLAIGDRDGEGFGESTYLRLLQIIDSSAPNAHVCSPRGFVAYYLPSPRALSAVEEVIAQAETLRDSDEACASIGIGLAQGPLIADFDWRGRVKPAFLPVGEVANFASRAIHGEQTYRQTLRELFHTQQT